MGHNGCDGSQASGPRAIGSGYRFIGTELVGEGISAMTGEGHQE